MSNHKKRTLPDTVAFSPTKLNVKSWSPGPGLPCTQVHLVSGFVPGVELVMRLKSKDVLDELIRALVEHRKDLER